MGNYREYGYSATVSAYLVTKGGRYELVKTNGRTFVLAQSSTILPGTQGRIEITVDGDTRATQVVLPDGAIEGNTTVTYKVLAPF